ncbi:MAG: ureidoglycolate lyase [Verrucomicrobiaceae bacterium]|jgi:2-keto-4-pentenoate hydratase/2-oxohepta-3-ene-1,7-dioic acid hydratase in catechol pathway|nr:ureidoglycolate lyase [Verrucomicrobiaceae bacterium]MEC9042039.1 fumarylacetoacetate hydrolase family protein [Verrucomicrobiota bacterium]MED5457001.1 fumarylacetoacetate hydrolase family protein [Verrucomicrobiota bacterium]|tara:strand:- start:603 stop:1460 length:858 start_codon:yes stop_codon:yes gene_type:complete
MKLIRFGKQGEEKPGILLSNDEKIDVSSFVSDYDEKFFESGGLVNLKDWLNENESSAPRLDDSIRLGSPIARPSKIICIGLNFKDHAAESGFDAPEEPLIFGKATSAICGPYDNIIIPRGSEQTDWEVELGVVIGKKTSYVDQDQALDHVGGYVLHNDVSERAFQKDRGGQWIKGKSADTFAPMGPFMATPDEIDNISDMRMWLNVNGENMQDGNTSNLIFSVDHVVSYLSQFMTLLPGDVISTGTPAGVGMGMNPEKYLKPGDVVELGIDGLGSSKQNVVAYEE